MSLAYQAFGSGPPVVLLHGLFGSGDNLRALARGLESRFEVFLPDLVNHGDSPHIPSSTHQAMVEAVLEFLDAHVPSQPVIGGHSIGGKLAMLVALHRPRETRALISIDMAPRRYQASHLELIEGMLSMPLEGVRSRRDADEMLASAVPNAAVRSFLLKNLVRDGERYRWRLNLKAIKADYDALLGWNPPDASYDGPALFVGGERSRYLQANRDTGDIRRRFPKAKVTMIPDAGHWLHADKPDELLGIMNRFLDGLDPA